MNDKSIRHLCAALALAAGIGLCQPGMAQQNVDDEETAQLEQLLQELQYALAKLQSLENSIRALQAYVDEQGRKTLVPRLAEGLNRSTVAPVFSKEEGEILIAEAQAALDEANAALAEAGDDAVATADAEALVAEAQALLDSVNRYPGLAELLPDPDIRFPALSSTLRTNFGDSSVSLSDNAHVKTISSDGEGGFWVTYVIGGQHQSVHLESDEYRSNFRNFGQVDGSRTTHVMWSYTDAFTREGTDRNQGSTEFDYFDGHGFFIAPGYRIYTSAGPAPMRTGFPLLPRHIRAA